MNLWRRTSAAVPVSPRLGSRGVVVLTALSYWCTCMALMYLNRRAGGMTFGLVAWSLWTWWGFQGAWKHMFAQEARAGRKRSIAMGSVTVLVAVLLFPGVLRGGAILWLCLSLLLLIGARAPRMRTDRDFYLALLVIMTVGFWLATDWAADWTLWFFYLGPAWLWGALALAWHHAAQAPLAGWKKITLACGFMALVVALTGSLFLWAPRPPFLGLGFLPGGEVQGWAGPRPEPGDGPGASGAGAGSARGSGSGGDAQGRAGARHEAGDGSGASDGWAGSARGSGPGGVSGWQAMIDAMRHSAQDASIPQWQRRAMHGMADQGQALQERWQSLWRTLFIPYPPWWWLLVLAAAWSGWYWRYRIGVQIGLLAAWGLQPVSPLLSMRLSTRSLDWALHGKGCRVLPGESLREHWLRYPHWPQVAHAWVLQVLDAYGSVRFGGAAATAPQARRVRQVVAALAGILHELPTMPRSAGRAAGRTA